MKIVLITLLTLIYINGISQYKSIFGINETSWNTLDHSSIASTDSSYVDGSLSVWGRSYNYITEIGHFGFTEFFLREDTVTGKVWYNSDLSDSSDYLIMDMSLILGDTFNLLTYDVVPTFEDIVVDSVYYIDGRKHIQFNFTSLSDPNYFLTMIEGIGRNNGMSKESITSPYNNTYLLCATKDSVQLYQSDYAINTLGISGCNYLSISNINEKEFNKISVFPNPTNGQINFESNNNFKIKRITIYDRTGQQIQSVNLNSTIYSLKLSPTPIGFYIVKIQFENETTELIKVIKT